MPGDNLKVLHISVFLTLALLAAANPKVSRAHTLVSTSQAQPMGAAIQASNADRFVDSIGVATHWGWYPNSKQLMDLLIKSGIRHVRDGRYNPSNMGYLASNGITQTLVVDPVTGVIPNANYWSGQPSANTYSLPVFLKTQVPPNFVDSIEMANELDIFYNRYRWHPKDQQMLSDDPSSPIYYGKYGIAFTKDCWNAIKLDPQLSSVTLVGPSVGVQVPSFYPDGSLYPYVDFGNFHPYPGRTNTWTYPQPYDTIKKYYWNSFQPSGNIGDDSYGGHPLLFEWYQQAFMSGPDERRMYATETGYHTAKQNSAGISPIAQAKYLPRLYAEYFRNDIVKTFAYELYDEGTSPTNGDLNFGLVYNNLTPKPAFTALSSLITLLSDRGSSFMPEQLAYKLAVMPSGSYSRVGYVHDLLLQKADGDFYLLLWHEVSSSSDTDVAGKPISAAQRDIAPPALSVTISLPSSILSVVAYTYAADWKLQATSLNIISGSVRLPATDTITVVRLSPRYLKL